MGVTLGVLPLLAYAYGKGDRRRLRSALRASAITVGGVLLIFGSAVFLFREQVFSAFSSDHSVLAIGVIVLTAQLVSAVFNGFAGLITSLLQATGRAVPAIVMSVAQGTSGSDCPASSGR
jgi:Na+-driven multidrug efflux pump